MPPAGIVGGLVGALFGMGGPPYVMYLTGRIADPAAQRATISQMVILNVGLRVAAFAVAGLLVSPALWLAVAVLLPVAIRNQPSPLATIAVGGTPQLACQTSAGSARGIRLSARSHKSAGMTGGQPNNISTSALNQPPTTPGSVRSRHVGVRRSRKTLSPSAGL